MPATIRYLKLRLNIYHHALKAWIESLQQLGLGLIAILPLAAHILVVAPLYIIGLLADPDTTTNTFLLTLWAYLLLVYTLLHFQQTGITGLSHRFYLRSLPVSPYIERLATVLLTFYGSSILLTAPYAFFIYIGIDKHSLFLAAPSRLLELIPLISTLILGTCYAHRAITAKACGYSLFLFPIVWILLAKVLTKETLLIAWFVLVILEPWLPKLGDRVTVKVSNWFNLLLIADKRSLQGDLLRLVTLVLITAVFHPLIQQVGDDVRPYFVKAYVFFSALVVASTMLSAKQRLTAHGLYFASMPTSKSKALSAAMAYAAVKSLVGIAIILLVGFLSPIDWLLWLAIFTASLWGAKHSPMFYVLNPVLISTALIAIKAVTNI